MLDQEDTDQSESTKCCPQCHKIFHEEHSLTRHIKLVHDGKLDTILTKEKVSEESCSKSSASNSSSEVNNNNNNNNNTSVIIPPRERTCPTVPVPLGTSATRTMGPRAPPALRTPWSPGRKSLTTRTTATTAKTEASCSAATSVPRHSTCTV